MNTFRSRAHFVKYNNHPPVCMRNNSSVFLQRGRCKAIPVRDTSVISVGTNIAVA